jgi:hypothetical protein
MGDEDGTQGHAHIKQVLYHLATLPIGNGTFFVGSGFGVWI